ncbi:hypothetical protein Hanom_Chr04g00360891 [Helianthus anomalus]
MDVIQGPFSRGPFSHHRNGVTDYFYYTSGVVMDDGMTGDEARIFSFFTSTYIPI